MIGLVDGNNFFVSCERVFDPSLEGKPVAVLSNNDGCCISRSNEFKALGIAMGTPYFQIRNMPGLILRSSNYELYGDLSRRVIATLNTLVPKVEQYSIDEAFIYPALPGNADYFSLGCELRQRVLKWVGIPCGVGFAPTKTLAKMANHIGKKSPSGVFVMPSDMREVLEKTPVAEVWGIGRRLAPQLERLGIRNAWQLSQKDAAEMKKKFSVNLSRTILELRGTACFEEDDPEEASKSITCSRSFGYPVVEFRELEESVAVYTAKAAEKLRKENLCAAGANIYFQMYPEYEPNPKPAGTTAITVTFPAPTDDTSRMLSAIFPKLKTIFIDGRRYKKSGVIFFGLESSGTVQPDLFSSVPKKENSALFKVVDNVNKKFGRGTVFTLSEGIEKKWQMKRELLSRNYTSDWSSLLEVK